MSEKPSDLPFFLAGVCSTAAALLVEMFLEQRGTTLIESYWETTPVGAVAFGMLCATGFGYGSRKFASRIGGWNSLGVLAILTLGYFGAQWLLFRRALPGGLTAQGYPVSFPTWFDAVTRHSYLDHRDGNTGEALGSSGYVWRVFELMATVASSFILPLFLGQPLCHTCNRCMGTKRMVSFPTGLDSERMGNGTPEHEAERARLTNAWRDAILEIFNSAGDSISLREALKKHDQKRGGSPKVQIELVHCRQCFAGKLLARLFEKQGMGWDKKLVGKRELQPPVIEQLLAA